MLLMDEPLAAVDAQTRRILQDELLATWGEQKPMAQRKTILYVTHSIEEAVYLADKIVVMSARPGRVRDVILNTLPRPRKDVRSSVEFVNRCQSLWALLETDAQHSMRFIA
jgi:NitT/TauT family transport system ATP-binding protein